MFKDVKTWLLLPLMTLQSFLFAFITTDISKSYVSCIIGIEYVGYWFVFFGLVAALGSLGFGYLIKFIGRITIVLSSIFLTLGLFVFYLLWKPTDNSYVTVYSLSVIHGIIEAVITTNNNCKLVYKKKIIF